MADSEDKGVGYKRPPKHTQFKKGQTGNPKGRPKNVRNFKTDLHDELSELIVIRENGYERKITKLRAIVKALVAAAVRGDIRATNAIVAFSTKNLAGSDEQSPVVNPDAEDKEIIDAFVQREIKREQNLSKPQTVNPKKEEP